MLTLAFSCVRSVCKAVVAATAPILLVLAVAGSQQPVQAQSVPGIDVRVSLPFDETGYLDDVKYKLRVPFNWNGTLLLYMQGSKSGPPPPEPILAPPVIGATTPSLEATLLSRGYALAASEVATSELQLKEEVQDTVALAAYFRGRVGRPNRVIAWGTSLGGLAAVKLAEDYPRTVDGAISTAAAISGLCLRTDLNLDFGLAYAVAFGWPDSWGPIGDLREGLASRFFQDVQPKVVQPDASNRGRWEFIRLVLGMPAESFWQPDPLLNAPGFGLNMWGATSAREGYEAGAGGPVASNVGRRYTLKAEDRSYLAGLGVNADDLLAKMNAQNNIQADPRARDYLHRYGDLRAMPKRPLITLHNTMDCMADVRGERHYRDAVAESGFSANLFQTYVKAIGHGGFTAKQLLTALAALEGWLDTGVKPDATSFPEADGFDNSFVPAPWPN